jgi:PE-PPE domain
MTKALLAAGAVAVLTMGVPIAGATTFVVGGTNGVGGKPSQGEMQGLVDQGFIPPDDLVGIDYPAQLWPVSGSVTLDDSVAQGVAALDEQVQHTSGPITIVGTSQGAVVLNYEKRRLMAQANPPQDVTFVTIADPTNSDGGVLAKFSPLYVPVLNFTFTGPPPATPYDTIEYVREYDGVSDFPDHPLNVVADLNAVAGGIYLHPNYGGLDPTAPDVVVTHSTNTLQGNTTHYLFPTKNLPLTQPLRDAGVDARLVDAIDKPLRKIIDAGYDGARPGRPGPSASESSARADGRPTVRRPIREAIKALRAARTHVSAG